MFSWLWSQFGVICPSFCSHAQRMRPNYDGANICIGTKKEQFSVNFTCDSWPENLNFKYYYYCLLSHLRLENIQIKIFQWKLFALNQFTVFYKLYRRSSPNKSKRAKMYGESMGSHLDSQLPHQSQLFICNFRCRLTTLHINYKLLHRLARAITNELHAENLLQFFLRSASWIQRAVGTWFNWNCIQYVDCNFNST